MKTPLYTGLTNDRIVVIQNGRAIHKHFPFDPYVLTDEPFRSTPFSCKPVRGRVIPNLDEQNLWMISAPTIHSFYSLRDKLEENGINSARLGYVEQILINRPQYFLAHPQTEPLRMVTLDIEVLTNGDGYFPRPDRNPIVSIGVKLNNEAVHLFDGYEATPGDSDHQILQEFRKWWTQVDPDVLITYNGVEFDLPYIMKRLTHWGMSHDFLARYEGKGDPLRGRVHFDCYYYAQADQNLMGIKTRGLKHVGAWFGHQFKGSLNMANTSVLLGTQEFEDYHRDDVEATWRVSKTYLPTAMMLADILHAPLNMVVGCKPSFIPKVLIGRNCARKGIVTIDNNLDRYTPTFGSVEYEGAMVEIHKTGYQDSIEKWDFTSMYPNAIRTLNLGSDTTKITGTRPIEPDDVWSCKQEGPKDARRLLITVPDTNLGKTVSIEVQLSEDGILKEEITRLMEERSAVKRSMETCSPEEKSALDSRQAAIKVVLNSIYGYLGSPYATYGDMASGIAITGFCRWVSTFVKQELGELVVNIDTDGFIKKQGGDLTKMNSSIAAYIKREVGLPSYMVLEEEPLIDGFFYRMKNYLLRKYDKRGNMVTIKHGVAFKSSRQAAIVDQAIDTISAKVFERIPFDQFEFCQSLLKMNDAKLDDYRLRLTFEKRVREYAQGSMHHKLGIQWEESSNTEIEPGLQIEFFVTKKQAPSPALIQWSQDNKGKVQSTHFTISAYVDSVKDINQEYYRSIICKFFDRFELDYNEQRSLF